MDDEMAKKFGLDQASLDEKAKVRLMNRHDRRAWAVQERRRLAAEVKVETVDD